jgi:transcriptional regulator with XRE-family HTH domain
MINKLPENIKNYRVLRHLSQKDLADLLNKSQNVVSNWERGANSPDIEIVLALCDIFDCSPNELFGYEESKELRILMEMKNIEKQKSDLEARLTIYAQKLSELQKNKPQD